MAIYQIYFMRPVLFIHEKQKKYCKKTTAIFYEHRFKDPS